MRVLRKQFLRVRTGISGERTRLAFCSRRLAANFPSAVWHLERGISSEGGAPGGIYRVAANANRPSSRAVRLASGTRHHD